MTDDEWLEHRRRVLAYRRATRFDGTPPKERNRTHGKASTYRTGCRCDECRAAKNAQARRRRNR